MPVCFQQLRGNVDRAARSTLADGYAELHPVYALGTPSQWLLSRVEEEEEEEVRPPTEQPQSKRTIETITRWCLPSSDRRGVRRLRRRPSTNSAPTDFVV